MKEKINNRQIFSMLFLLRTTVVISTLPVLTSADAMQDAWASALVTFVTTAIIIFVVVKLGTRYPQLTFVGYAKKLLGKWPGRLISLILVWNLFNIAVVETRINAEIVITGFLTDTPLLFVITSMALAVALAAYNGIEVIARAADLIFPLFLLIILISLTTFIPSLPVGAMNLEPVLARGAAPVLRGALTPTATGFRFIILAMLIPVVNRPKKVLKSSMGALALSMVYLVIAAIGVVVVLGPEAGARSPFPFFSMLRSVRISEFLERVEIVTIFAWGFGAFIGMSILFYCSARGLAQILGLNTYRPLVGPLILIFIVMADHSFEDMFQLRTLYQPSIVLPYTSVLFISTIGVLWIKQLLSAPLAQEDSNEKT